MTQKKLPLINSAHGSDTRNIINELIKLFNSMGYTYDEALQKAHDVLNEAQQTNDMNENVQQQIDTLIAESGTSDSEVLQARIDAEGNEYTVLKERLDASDDRLNDTAKVINVKHHGAKGDGTTDDWAAIQGAIALAETTGRSVFLPSGEYYVSQTLRTKHMRTYNYSYGIRVYGNGKDTILKRDDLRTGADYNANLSDQAVFAVHGSNNIVEKMSYHGGLVGLYLGQDPSSSQNSSVAMNVVNDIWYDYCGTNLVLQHGQGTHYNKFKNHHGIHSQIGVHLAKGLSIDRVNNNRNVFENFRMSRTWIGYYVEDGDGNFFNKIYSETIGGGQAIGEFPDFAPAGLNGKATAIVAGGQYNVFDNVSHEDVEWDIYNHGFRNMFDSMMIKDDADAKVTLETIPLKYQGNSTIMAGIRYQPSYRALYDGDAGVSFTHQAQDIYHQTRRVNLVDLSDNIISSHNNSDSHYKRLGLVVDWAANYRFSVDSNKLNDPIRIQLPDDGDKKLVGAHTANLSNPHTMPFEVFYGTSATMPSKLRGRYSTDSEASNFGGEHIVINPPSSGWDGRSQVNYMSFMIRYMKLW